MSHISPYLRDLEHTLLTGARWRRRILEEAADHLAESVANHEERGLSRSKAEREALREFGEVGPVADAFARSRKGVDTMMRWSKYLALVGGVGFALAVSAWRIDDTILDGYVAGAPGLLLLAALPGMHLRQASRSGRLGRVGFFLISAAVVLTAIMPAGITGAKLLYEGDSDPAYAMLSLGLLAVPILVSGLVVFAASAVKARVFPTMPMVLLLVSSAALPLAFDQDWAFFPSVIPAWTFSAAWIWLGVTAAPLLPPPIENGATATAATT